MLSKVSSTHYHPSPTHRDREQERGLEVGSREREISAGKKEKLRGIKTERDGIIY